MEPTPHPTPDCAQFTPYLPLLDLHLLSEHDAVQLNAHVAGCAYCQRERAHYRRIDVTLRRSLSQPIPLFARNDLHHMLNTPPSLRSATVNERNNMLILSPQTAIRRWQLIAGVVGVLVVVTGTFALLALRHQSQGAPPSATAPSTTTQHVLVPNFVGSTLAAAKDKASHVGLTLQVIYTQNASAPTNTVIAQDPADGTTVAVNATVTITVNSGPALIQVPSVAGETKDQACADLRKVDLQCNIAGSATSSLYPISTVDHTDPPEGALVAPNTVINLYISAGAP